MPYIVFNELSLFFDNENAVKEIYSLVKDKYPSRNCEEVIKNNIEYAKKNCRNNNSDFSSYIRKAIENDYAANEKIENEEQAEDILEELTKLFHDKDRASRVYISIKNKYPDINHDELIKTNIQFARKKEKKLKMMFLGYLEETISKNLAGYR
jgi:hypothetical protein